MFGKPIDQLTFNDVVAFLNKGVRECVTLDYKRDLPSAASIARLACAFANTMGGFMVFGADEQNEMPVPPFEGGDLGNNPNQTIHAACQSIVPAVVPVLGRILNNPIDPTKRFLVVAIPQSGYAPHSMASDGRVYVKVRDHKEPVQPSLEMYESLRQNRQLSVGRTVTATDETQNKLADRWRRNVVPSALQTTVERHVEINITIRRAFPMEGYLATPQQLVARYMDYHVLLGDPFLHQIILPADAENMLQTYARGANCERVGRHSEEAICTVIHRDGVLSVRAWIAGLDQGVTLRTGESSDVYVVPAESVCAFAFAAIRCGLRMLRCFGGYCAVDLSIEVSTSDASEVYTTNPMDRTLYRDMPKRSLLGPAELGFKLEHRLAWPSAEELEKVEREFATTVVSAFDVVDSNYVELILQESRRRVRTAL
jgi:hypothetical protein